MYTLSLHDALPISGVVAARAVTTGAANFGVLAAGTAASGVVTARAGAVGAVAVSAVAVGGSGGLPAVGRDRKSTRLNSSHRCISYAVLCLKKKNNALDKFLKPDTALNPSFHDERVSRSAPEVLERHL